MSFFFFIIIYIYIYIYIFYSGSSWVKVIIFTIPLNQPNPHLNKTQTLSSSHIVCVGLMLFSGLFGYKFTIFCVSYLGLLCFRCWRDLEHLATFTTHHLLFGLAIFKIVCVNPLGLLWPCKERTLNTLSPSLHTSLSSDIPRPTHPTHSFCHVYSLYSQSS